MNILEICPFSAGGCGVWNRVLSESREFEKLGYKVTILSSDLEKSTLKKIKPLEFHGSIKIHRFAGKASVLSSNVISWFNSDAKKKIIELVSSGSIDIIITHLLHPHSISLAKMIPTIRKINPDIKFFIVPHAPFEVARRFPLSLVTSLWNRLNLHNLRLFDKVISIAQWEIPYLEKIVLSEKIVYIPNGLQDAFFNKQQMTKKEIDVIFLGRIAPVKNIEFIVDCAKKLPEVSFLVVGPAEPVYIKQIKSMSKNVDNLSFDLGIYDSRKEIGLLNKSIIFLLPSHREAMPQVLLEALSQGNIVLASNTNGSREILTPGKNGFIFNLEESNEAITLIKSNLHGNKEISSNAKNTAKNYRWSKLIKKYFNKDD